MMRTGRLALLLLMSLLLAACGRNEPATGRSPTITALAAPGTPGAALPHLAQDAQGEVWLSWVEPEQEAHALKLARLVDDAWHPVATVARGEGWFINWADFPAVVPLADGTLAAHWLEKTPGGIYSYDIRLSTSRDGGRSWSAPLSPHRDGTRTEHGFATLFAWNEAGGAVWLDGRQTAEEAAHESDHHGSGDGGAMTLHWTRFAADGFPEPERLLDQRVCDCCQTDVAMTARGPVVVYRDRDQREIRDIAIVRWEDSDWSRPALVHADGWHMPACPVNGPAVDAMDHLVVVAWFTGAAERPRVNIAFSTDAGASFGAVVEVDAGRVIGRVDVALLDADSAAVSWVTRQEQGAELRFRRVDLDGTLGPQVFVSRTSAMRGSGFPQMLRSGDRLVFAWTEAAETSRLRTAFATF